jgi:ATP-dependent Clp protease protease subunit
MNFSPMGRAGFQPNASGLQVPGGVAPAGPSSRYILPQFEERTAYGYKRQDPYAKLFEDRIIFLGVQVDDASADDVMAQLLVLESQDPDGVITMYINSPGGSFTALTAIYDTMQYIKPEIQTVCLGQAASAAAVLLAAGSPGRRLALPNARVMIHQPALEGGGYAQASDIEIHANEVQRMRSWLEATLAHHTGRDLETVSRDIERDKILTAARPGASPSPTATTRPGRSPSEGVARPLWAT